jgi:hypothetical protein
VFSHIELEELGAAIAAEGGAPPSCIVYEVCEGGSPT